ncbi:MAG: hypothetical protein WD492_06355 [Alkalispirochaeta sp.]
MRRSVSVLLLLASLVSAAAVALPHQPTELTGIDEYRRAETLVYSEHGSTAEIRALLEEVRRKLRSESNLAFRSYWIARTHLLMATHHNQQDDSRSAQQQVESGFAAIEDALSRGGEFSEGLRVQADLHAQMMFARGMIYIARYGNEARRQALRAMELDPGNAGARITVAGFYLNAPGIAGGDTEKGTAILESTLEQHAVNESERFLILGLLAETYTDAGDTARATHYVRRAEEIYPNSPWLTELRSAAGS